MPSTFTHPLLEKHENMQEILKIGFGLRFGWQFKWTSKGDLYIEKHPNQANNSNETTEAASVEPDFSPSDTLKTLGSRLEVEWPSNLRVL